MTGIMTSSEGEKMAYTLSVDVSGVHLSGKSVTVQEGNELLTNVSGIINRDKKLMIITETSTIGILSDSIEVCLFNIMVKWKEKKGKFSASGAFVGKNSAGQVCSQGIAELETGLSATSLFSPIPEKEKKKTTQHALPDTAATATDDNQITDGRDKYINVSTPSCVLELWDDGIEDGDVITLLFNGKEIVRDYTLSKTKKLLTVPLNVGKNKVTIVAVSEGVNPPNTAQIAVTEQATGIRYSLTAYNKKGKMASVVITRK